MELELQTLAVDNSEFFRFLGSSLAVSWNRFPFRTELFLLSNRQVWMRKAEMPPAPSALNAAAPEFTPSFQSFLTPSTGTESDYGCGVSGYCDSYDWTPAVATWEPTAGTLPEVVPGTREGEYLGLQCILKEYIHVHIIYTYIDLYIYIIYMSLLDQLLAEHSLAYH